ncbi:MAG TPA: hypothetical protein DIS76_07345 [Rhodospirillaceae bacterium]|nr:hypothetical protein [Rhodospirillaceae bacterium]
MAMTQLLLENYIAELRIGIHPHERAAPQRVSVSVTAELRAAPHADQIAETYDYVNIVNAVQEMAKTHMDLLESFARELAARLLADKKIKSVDIKLLKLDILAGGQLGVRYCAP